MSTCPCGSESQSEEFEIIHDRYHRVTAELCHECGAALDFATKPQRIIAVGVMLATLKAIRAGAVTHDHLFLAAAPSNQQEERTP